MWAQIIKQNENARFVQKNNEEIIKKQTTEKNTAVCFFVLNVMYNDENPVITRLRGSIPSVLRCVPFGYRSVCRTASG